MDLSPADEVEKYRLCHYPTVGNYRIQLGPPIRPDHKVPTGKGIWPSAPMVVDIDLLLTAS